MHQLAQPLYWKIQVCVDGCVMCRAFPPTVAERRVYAAEIGQLRAHHVFLQQQLRRMGIDEFADIDCGVCLCDWHHQRHHSGAQRLPARLLSDANRDFGRRHGLLWVIEDRSVYP